MKAIIISLNFHPGHVCHMVASYKQCEDLRYESTYDVARVFCDFLPKDSWIVTNDEKVPEADLALKAESDLLGLPIFFRFWLQNY